MPPTPKKKGKTTRLESGEKFVSVNTDDESDYGSSDSDDQESSESEEESSDEQDNKKTNNLQRKSDIKNNDTTPTKKAKNNISENNKSISSNDNDKLVKLPGSKSTIPQKPVLPGQKPPPPASSSLPGSKPNPMLSKQSQQKPLTSTATTSSSSSSTNISSTTVTLPPRPDPATLPMTLQEFLKLLAVSVPKTSSDDSTTSNTTSLSSSTTTPYEGPIENALYQYFFSQNRPRTAANVFDLTEFKKYSKSALDPALQNLVKKGTIICKEFSKTCKVYYINQSLLPQLPDNIIELLPLYIILAQHELNDIDIKQQSIHANIKLLQSQPTTSSLNDEISLYKQNIKVKQDKLTSLAEIAQDPNYLIKLKHDYDVALTAWKRYKHSVYQMISIYRESAPSKKPKEILRQLGIDGDEDSKMDMDTYIQFAEYMNIGKHKSVKTIQQKGKIDWSKQKNSGMMFHNKR